MVSMVRHSSEMLKRGTGGWLNRSFGFIVVDDAGLDRPPRARAVFMPAHRSRGTVGNTCLLSPPFFFDPAVVLANGIGPYTHTCSTNHLYCPSVGKVLATDLKHHFDVLGEFNSHLADVQEGVLVDEGRSKTYTCAMKVSICCELLTVMGVCYGNGREGDWLPTAVIRKTVGFHPPRFFLLLSFYFVAGVP